MADRPMIFSGAMVRALLEGRKTQTRRLLKPQPGGMDRPFAMEDGTWHVTDSRGCNMSPLPVRYAVGDRLWVREACRVAAWRGEDRRVALDYRATPEDVRTPWLRVPEDEWDRLWQQSSEDARLAGEAGRGSTRRDGDGWRWDRGDSPCRWRPPIHMPRWASRLTLLVRDVRVQRLQDISTADAEAEGCTWNPGAPWNCRPAAGLTDAYRSQFADLWNRLHGEDAWAANPWVVALTFDVQRRNIDA